MISFEHNQRIAAMQERVIRSSLMAMKEDGHHKSSEAAITVSMNIPNMFQADSRITWSVTVYSYLLGPSRNHYFNGNSIGEAISKAEDAVKDWCFAYEMKAFEDANGLGKDLEEYEDKSESESAQGEKPVGWDDGPIPF